MKSKTLIIILVVLAGLLSIDHFLDKSDSTLLTDLVAADTTEISAIAFYPKAFGKKEIKFNKESDIWMLSFENTKVGVDDNMLNGILLGIQNLKPVSLASNSDSKWEKYEVTDSLGIRLVITDNAGETTELILGKFDYNQETRVSVNYVRVANSDEVYAVDGYLSMAFDRTPESFRDRSLITADHLLWTRVTYTYPGDSSFVMISNQGRWEIEGVKTDSISAINYLASMGRLGGNLFVDDLDISELTPTHTIVFEGENIDKITLNAFYVGEPHGFVVTSSENKYAVVSGNDLFDRTFISKDAYTKEIKNILN